LRSRTRRQWQNRLMSEIPGRADMRCRLSSSRFAPLATNAVQQTASYSITSWARAGVLPDRMSTPRRPDGGVPQRPRARTRRPRQPCSSCHPLKLFFVPRPRRRVCALLS
jgi:hypothetical protein